MIFQSRKPLAIGTVLRVGGPEHYVGVVDEHGEVVQAQPMVVLREVTRDDLVAELRLLGIFDTEGALLATGYYYELATD